MEHVVEMVSSVWTKLSTALEILVPSLAVEKESKTLQRVHRTILQSRFFTIDHRHHSSIWQFEYLTRSSPMNQMLYIYYKKLLRLGGACSLSWILLCDYLGWISRNITRPQKRSSPPQKSLLWRETSPCLWKPRSRFEGVVRKQQSVHCSGPENRIPWAGLCRSSLPNPSCDI